MLKSRMNEYLLILLIMIHTMQVPAILQIIHARLLQQVSQKFSNEMTTKTNDQHYEAMHLNVYQKVILKQLHFFCMTVDDIHAFP